MEKYSLQEQRKIVNTYQKMISLTQCELFVMNNDKFIKTYPSIVFGWNKDKKHLKYNQDYFLKTSKFSKMRKFSNFDQVIKFINNYLKITNYYLSSKSVERYFFNYIKNIHIYHSKFLYEFHYREIMQDYDEYLIELEDVKNFSRNFKFKISHKRLTPLGIFTLHVEHYTYLDLVNLARKQSITNLIELEKRFRKLLMTDFKIKERS